MKTLAQTKVWDPLVRLFHWTLVLTFSLCYFTQEESYELHIWSGYVVLGALLVRVIWGFVGSRYARFRDFLYSPRQIVSYLKQVLRGAPERYLGHNPAGGAMIFVLLIGCFIIGLSGIALDGAENRAGPLANFQVDRYLSNIRFVHEMSTYLTLAMVFIHVSGVILESKLHRENLIRAMITGRKRS